MQGLSNIASDVPPTARRDPHVYSDSPLSIPLSEDTMQHLKRQLPAVYQALCASAVAQRELQERLMAKETELLRCIGAGQEVVDQLEAVLQYQKEAASAAPSKKKTAVGRTRTPPAAAGEKGRRPSGVRRLPPQEAFAAHGDPPPTLIAACALLPEAYAQVCNVLRHTRHVLLHCYEAAEQEQHDSKQKPQRKGKVAAALSTRRGAGGGRPLPFPLTAAAPPELTPPPLQAPSRECLGKDKAAVGSDQPSEGTLSEWLLGAMEALRARLTELQGLLPGELEPYLHAAQASRAAAAGEAMAHQLAHREAMVQVQQLQRKIEAMEVEVVQRRAAVGPRRPEEAGELAKASVTLGQLRQSVLQSAAAAANAALAQQHDKLREVHELAIQNIQERLNAREAALKVSARHLAEAQEREDVLRQRIDWLERDAVEAAAEREVLRRQQRQAAESHKTEREQWAALLAEAAALWKDVQPVLPHHHRPDRRGAGGGGGQGSGGGGGGYCHSHELEASLGVQERLTALYRASQAENHRLQEELYRLQQRLAARDGEEAQLEHLQHVLRVQEDVARRHVEELQEELDEAERERQDAHVKEIRQLREAQQNSRLAPITALAARDKQPEHSETETATTLVQQCRAVQEALDASVRRGEEMAHRHAEEVQKWGDEHRALQRAVGERDVGRVALEQQLRQATRQLPRHTPRLIPLSAHLEEGREDPRPPVPISAVASGGAEEEEEEGHEGPLQREGTGSPTDPREARAVLDPATASAAESQEGGRRRVWALLQSVLSGGVEDAPLRWRSPPPAMEDGAARGRRSFHARREDGDAVEANAPAAAAIKAALRGMTLVTLRELRDTALRSGSPPPSSSEAGAEAEGVRVPRPPTTAHRTRRRQSSSSSRSSSSPTSLSVREGAESFLHRLEPHMERLAQELQLVLQQQSSVGPLHCRQPPHPAPDAAQAEENVTPKEGHREEVVAALEAQLQHAREELAVLSSTLKEREREMAAREQVCLDALNTLQQAVWQDMHAMYGSAEAGVMRGATTTGGNVGMTVEDVLCGERTPGGVGLASSVLETESRASVHEGGVLTWASAPPPPSAVASGSAASAWLTSTSAGVSAAQQQQRVALAQLQQLEKGVEDFCQHFSVVSLREHMQALEVLRAVRRQYDDAVLQELEALRRVNEVLEGRLVRSNRDRDVVRQQLHELLTTPPRSISHRSGGGATSPPLLYGIEGHHPYSAEEAGGFYEIISSLGFEVQVHFFAVLYRRLPMAPTHRKIDFAFYSFLHHYGVVVVVFSIFFHLERTNERTNIFVLAVVLLCRSKLFGFISFSDFVFLSAIQPHSRPLFIDWFIYCHIAPLVDSPLVQHRYNTRNIQLDSFVVVCLFVLPKIESAPSEPLRGKGKVPHRSQGGLTFGESGLTPRTSHPGQEVLAHPHIAKKARQHQDQSTAFQYSYQASAGGPGKAVGLGRRHVDPQHVDVSDAMKLEEGRLGRATHPAGQQQVRGHLQVGTNAPLPSEAETHSNPPQQRGAKPRPSTVIHTINNTPRGGATSVQCSEAILRRMLKDQDPVYRDAARHALEQCMGEAELVRAEKQISHHKVVRQFAEESAAKRVASERAVVPPIPQFESAQEMASNPQHQLGSMGVHLAQSTPFALDNYPAEAALSQGPPPPQAHTSTQRPSKKYQTNFSSIHLSGIASKQQRQEAEERQRVAARVAAPFTTAPFDSMAASPQGRYPAPPPVGVSEGLRDKHYLVQHSPQHNQSRLGLDADTLNFQRAQALRAQHYGPGGAVERFLAPAGTEARVSPRAAGGFAPYANEGSTVICGSAMTGCYENKSEYNRRYNPAACTPSKLTSTSAGKMEARCHARDEADGQRHTVVVLFCFIYFSLQSNPGSDSNDVLWIINLFESYSERIRNELTPTHIHVYDPHVLTAQQQLHTKQLAAATEVRSIVAPTVNEAADALFTQEEKAKLRANLIEEQIQHAKYLRAHPEIDRLLQIAIGKLVRDQPEDAVAYLTQLFAENDLEEMEAAYAMEEQRLHDAEREKHAQLANPESTCFSWNGSAGTSSGTNVFQRSTESGEECTSLFIVPSFRLLEKARSEKNYTAIWLLLERPSKAAQKKGEKKEKKGGKRKERPNNLYDLGFAFGKKTTMDEFRASSIRKLKKKSLRIVRCTWELSNSNLSNDKALRKRLVFLIKRGASVKVSMSGSAHSCIRLIFNMTWENRIGVGIDDINELIDLLQRDRLERRGKWMMHRMLEERQRRRSTLSCTYITSEMKPFVCRSWKQLNYSLTVLDQLLDEQRYKRMDWFALQFRLGLFDLVVVLFQLTLRGLNPVFELFAHLSDVCISSSLLPRRLSRNLLVYLYLCEENKREVQEE
eukprot:gene6365-4590_t